MCFAIYLSPPRSPTLITRHIRYPNYHSSITNNTFNHLLTSLFYTPKNILFTHQLHQYHHIPQVSYEQLSIPHSIPTILFIRRINHHYLCNQTTLTTTLHTSHSYILLTPTIHESPPHQLYFTFTTNPCTIVQ